jgi:hypothetical protein
VGNRGSALSGGVFGWLLGRRQAALQPAGAVTFNQQGAMVGSQTNVGRVDQMTVYGARGKLPLSIERFTYRLDRTPQCAALQRHLEAMPKRDRPVCAIVIGTENDLPRSVGETLFDFVEQEVLQPRKLSLFQKVRSPLCVQWSNHFVDCDWIWREIGQKFLDLPALNPPERVRAALGERPNSIAFGFELYVDDWTAHGPILAAWIDSLRQCRAPPGGLALAVIVLSGGLSRTATLHNLRAELDRRYVGDPDVLVLPMLKEVEFGDVRIWRAQLLEFAGSSVQEGKLQTLALDLFPDDTMKRRMGDIWKEVRAQVEEAWSPP